MANIAIIDDNVTIREGLKTLINQNSEHKCSGSYSDCKMFFDEYEKNVVDVVLLDISLQKGNVTESIKKINALENAPHIIVLSLYGENESLFKALCAGAQGYILKKTPSDQFLMIIDEIIEERSRMSAAIANKIISGTKRKNIASLQKLKESFDEDEFKILSFMRQGNSAAAVAELLDISLVQIQKHFFRIYGKLKEVRFVV
ncbi:MAG: hypothetical protein CVV23_00855 [Ignavibacteriae bacterium HGW-Ignavibacteriae-2]|nr:response regulator transcription factor [Bacteroidota bacterium]PKL90434.1 MAG: hypothetical protein CVV23_00855 [Ignavibacteriae bacterium HGW-Ignavibacteriae-2]